MAGHADECTKLGIPYLYDPSMQAPRMTAVELEAGFKGAKVLTGNDSTRILFSKNADLDCEKLELPSSNKRYQLQVEKVRFRSQNNSFYNYK